MQHQGPCWWDHWTLCRVALQHLTQLMSPFLSSWRRDFKDLCHSLILQLSFWASWPSGKRKLWPWMRIRGWCKLEVFGTAQKGDSPIIFSLSTGDRQQRLKTGFSHQSFIGFMQLHLGTWFIFPLNLLHLNCLQIGTWIIGWSRIKAIFKLHLGHSKH